MTSYAAAVDALVGAVNWNPWFLNTCWPEDSQRVKSISELAVKSHPPADGRQPAALEVGCANGYNTVIDRGDIHDREYPAWIVADLMKEIGLRIERVQSYRAGIAPTHSAAKKAFKTLLALSGLSKTRPFALGYIIEARKPS